MLYISECSCETDMKQIQLNFLGVNASRLTIACGQIVCLSTVVTIYFDFCLSKILSFQRLGFL